MFPRALQELLQSSPGEHPSDATCLIPRRLCSNQRPRRKLSSASLTRMAFHDSLFHSVSPTSTVVQQGALWAGSNNWDRPTATTSSKRKPGRSGCQRNGAAQVEKRGPARLLYGCARSSPLRPREVGKQLNMEELQPSGSSTAVSRGPGQPHTKEDHARSETYS